MIDLTTECHCVEEDGEPWEYCDDCGGSGEVLTENGRNVIELVRKFLFK